MDVLRVRLRTLLILVAATAIALGLLVTGERWARRSRHFHWKAADYSARARQLSGSADELSFRIASQPLSTGNPTQAAAIQRIAELRRLADYYWKLRQKYAEASDRPWKAVEPDSPPPD
jgi:hypothetical protein